MDEILHHLETMGNPWFVGICRAINIPKFLRWCEMDFIHPQSKLIICGFLSCSFGMEKSQCSSWHRSETQTWEKEPVDGSEVAMDEWNCHALTELRSVAPKGSLFKGKLEYP